LLRSEEAKMKLFEVGVVAKPICTDPDCDEKENPDHYVRIRFTPEVVSVLRKTINFLRSKSLENALCDREQDHDLAKAEELRASLIDMVRSNDE
jgi:hypothetical protein